MKNEKPKLIRTSTIAASLDILIKGQLGFLNQYYNVIAVSGMDDHLQNVEKREGVRVHDIPMSRPISIRQDLVSFWKLYTFFRKEKPRIVHSITPKAGLLSMAAAYFARVPIRVHTFTGLVFPSKSGSVQLLLILMDRLLCTFATKVIPEGEGVKRDLTRFKITRKRLSIIGQGNVNGIDINFFNPDLFTEEDVKKLKIDLGVESTDFVFVFVGRLVGDKGINELIAAFSALRKNSNSVKLLIVGQLQGTVDPLHPITHKMLANEPSIIKVGYQKDIRLYLRISDALVFPSYREGFPNVVMQAGAMGLPSIVTDINGSNEIIKEGINGTIIPVKSITAIEVAMAKMMSDQAWRNSLRANARTMIVTRFEQKVLWNALLDEYRYLENQIK